MSILLAVVFCAPFSVLLLWMNLYINKRDREWRRPLREMQRSPGWSLLSRLDDLSLDTFSNMMLTLIIGIIFWIISLQLRNQFMAVIIGLPVACFMAWRSCGLFKQLANFRLGLRCEQLVGQALERISSKEIQVFHDLVIDEPGSKPRNIDHVVVSPAGVYAIETKGRRKPKIIEENEKGHQVVFDGTSLIYPGGLKRSGASIRQALSGAEWLSKYLSEMNAERVEVNAVLVIPGWFIDRKQRANVAVINETEIGKFFYGQPQQLSPKRFQAICAQIAKRCRVEF